MKYPKYYGLSILAILLLVQNPIAAAAGSNFSTDKQLIDVILPPVKFAENEAGIIPKFKHKT